MVRVLVNRSGKNLSVNHNDKQDTTVKQTAEHRKFSTVPTQNTE